MVKKTRPGIVLGDPGDTSNRPTVKRTRVLLVEHQALQRRDHGDGGRQRVAAVAARRGSGMGLVALHLDREPA